MLNLLQNKCCALNAAPVNSAMLLVWIVAQCVQIQHTLVTKEETAVALIVQLVGCPMTAVQNVICAMPAHFAEPEVFVQHACLVFIKMTKVKQNAANVHWENCMSMPKQPAVVVTLVHLAAAKVTVLLAQKVFIKTTNIEKNVLDATTVNCSSMSKLPVMIVAKVNLEVAMALVQHAQLVIFKIPKVNKNAVILATQLEKYPIVKVLDVNCHCGVHAKWENI